MPDTFAQSHLSDTVARAAAAADQAATNKTSKYTSLANTHIFMPLAVETGGPWNIQAIEFIQDLGKRISDVTNEPLETQYLFQRLSMAVQQGNAVAFSSTFPAS